MPKQQQTESKDYHLYHQQTKCILVSHDVFVEDATQPLLSCTKETSVSPKDVYDTLLPLFTSGQLSVGPLEAPCQPLEATHNDEDHSISDADLQDALIDVRADIEEAKIVPKLLFQTLQEVLLSYHTRSGSHSAHAYLG